MEDVKPVAGRQPHDPLECEGVHKLNDPHRHQMDYEQHATGLHFPSATKVITLLPTKLVHEPLAEQRAAQIAQQHVQQQMIPPVGAS